MRIMILALALFMVCPLPQYAHAEAPAMRLSNSTSILYGANALQNLRKDRSELFQNAKGVLIIGVQIASQAEAAGIRICDVTKEEMGDVVVSYAGQPIDSAESLVAIISEYSSANKDVDMVVLRNNEKVVVKLTSGRVGIQPLTVASLDNEALSPSGYETKITEVANKPHISVQLGGASGAVAFSRDGRFALTGFGKVVKLLDVSSGREIRTLDGHAKQVVSVAISPNGRYALSGSPDGVFKLWDLTTGNAIQSFKHLGAVNLPIIFSRDGRQALSGGGDGVTLWDLATGLKIRTMVDVIKPPGSALALAISPDGRQVLSSSLSFDNGFFVLNPLQYELKLWDFATGKLLHIMKGHSAFIFSVAFSPDGRQALSGSYDKTVKLWDLATGDEIRSIGHSNAVNSVAFSPDGKQALSTADDGINLWELPSGKAILKIGRGSFHQAVFSPDGRQALGLAYNLSAFDISSGKLVRRFDSIASNPNLETIQTAFSPDGSRIVSGGNVTEIWEVTTGRGMLRVPEGTGITSIAFSSDGSKILSGHLDKTVKLLDADTGKLIRSFTGHTGFIKSVALSRDGKQALSLGSDSEGALGKFADGLLKEIGYSSKLKNDTIRLWDIATGEVIRTLEHPGAQSATLSPDGKQALSGAPSGTKLWDLASGEAIRTFKGNTLAAVFSPDGHYALVSSYHASQYRGGTGTLFLKNFYEYSRYGTVEANIFRLLDLETGQEVRKFIGHSDEVSSVAFSPDGKLALSGSRDQTVKLWDVATGKMLRTFAGHLGNVGSVSFSPDGRLALSGSQDMSTRIWEVASGREIIQMASFDDGGWLSITPEGYFIASSTKAAENINIRMGMNVYGIDQFYDVFYRPDIVESALAGKDTAGMVTLTIADALNNPPPVIEKIETPNSNSDNTVKLGYRIKSNGGGIGDVRVFHNGKLVKSDGVVRKMPDSLVGKKANQVTSELLVSQMRGLAIVATKDASLKGSVMTQPKPDMYESSVEIEPIPGENDISVVAFNSQNSIQSNAKMVSFTSTKPPVAPNLYILTVGIDKYKEKTSNLKFAAKDSGDIAARWKAQAANIYGEQNIFVETLSNTQASREGILAKINQIAGRAKPTDHFVLFVASHGVLLGDQYYMVTSDYDGALRPSQLIGANEIVGFSKSIKALSQLYILDTCHAGGMGGVINGLYDARVSVLAKKMGLHVFASASSAEEALDGFEGNGLFTHTLLYGLNNNKQADTNSDKKVSLMELGSYSKRLTKEIATRMRHKQDPLIIDFGQDTPVYMLQ
jgi:WD40 repeat protein